MSLQRFSLVALACCLTTALAATFTQNVCQDAGCSVACVSTTYSQHACYGTLVEGSSVEVWCKSENSVVVQRVYPGSANCTGFDYDRTISANACVQGQYAYIEYFCNAGSLPTSSNVTKLNIAPVVYLPAETSSAVKGPSASSTRPHVDQGREVTWIPSAMLAHQHSALCNENRTITAEVVLVTPKGNDIRQTVLIPASSIFTQSRKDGSVAVAAKSIQRLLAPVAADPGVACESTVMLILQARPLHGGRMVHLLTAKAYVNEVRKQM